MSAAKPEWRRQCRAIAFERATIEAQIAQQLAPDEAPVFTYRWDHVQRVVKIALWLADKTGADCDIVEAAAWLHDIRKGEPDHGKVGASESEEILGKTDFPAEKIAVVTDAIARHVGLTRRTDAAPLEPVECAVLWDADKLTKLGASVIAYQLSTQQLDGLTLVEQREEMQHFMRKVLLKTVESMNTTPARDLALVRYRAMASFLDDWESEDSL
jgi:uncharacterized protein